MADATGGMKGNLCNIKLAFAQYAQFVVDHAAVTPPSADYKIKLDHTPILETIAVRVNGRLISQSPTDGWSYDPTDYDSVS